MNWLALINPCSRLEQRPFAFALVCVLLLSVASLALLIVPVLVKAKLSLFASMQAVLLWAWFSLHVNRLRDAGFSIVRAVGLSIFGSLMLGILVVGAVEFLVPAPSNEITENLLASDLVEFVRALLEELFDFNEEDSARTTLEIVPYVAGMRHLLAATMMLGLSIWAAGFRSVTRQS